MRWLACLLLGLAAFPAQAWEAGIEGRVCTLDHATDAAQVRLTYDPALPEYAIMLTRDEPWPRAPVFAMRFDGAHPLFITTDRHVLSDDNATLTVTDRGFGNVLDGLQFNFTAFALTGNVALVIPLDGAAPEVAAFRACTTTPSA